MYTVQSWCIGTKGIFTGQIVSMRLTNHLPGCLVDIGDSAQLFSVFTFPINVGQGTHGFHFRKSSLIVSTCLAHCVYSSILPLICFHIPYSHDSTSIRPSHNMSLPSNISSGVCGLRLSPLFLCLFTPFGFSQYSVVIINPTY